MYRNISMSLELKKFDMGMISDDKVVVFIGKRETGKSFLVKDMLYHHQYIPVGTVISGTEGANAFYSNMMPSIFIHGEYKPELIQNVLKRQKKVITQIKKENEEYGSCNIDPRAFLILDDCLYDKSWINNKYIRSLFMNGRHYKMMFIITMQYSLGIPPNLRTNVDFVFILRENYVSNRKRLYEQYAGMFPHFDIFCQVMDQCTENYECIVVNINAKSNKLEDRVFWYKAEAHDDFQLGAPQLWQFHDDNYNPNFEDSDDEELDMNANRRKKGKIVVNVKKSHY